MNFEKPEYKITEYVEKNSYGRFELEPLERGFGTTIGNALRRVMLSSLPGSAITSVKIDGVLHEFQKIDGVVEDVTAIILNLKSVVIKNNTQEEKVIRIDVTGDEDERVVKAVNDISFEVEEGETVAFIGPNGAGKRTTIEMITGVLNIDEGDILIDGKSIIKKILMQLKSTAR